MSDIKGQIRVESRNFIANHPYTACIACLVVGLVLGFLVRGIFG